MNPENTYIDVDNTTQVAPVQTTPNLDEQTKATLMAMPSEQNLPTPSLNNSGSRKKIIIIAAVITLIILSLAVGVVAMTTPSKKSVVKVTPAPAVSASDTSSLSAAYDSFSTAGIKEFTSDKKVATLASYASLVEGFSFKDGFLKDSSTNLMALGIAYLYTDASSEAKDGYKNEMYLLAKPYLKSTPSGITDLDGFSSLSTDQSKQVYSKFEDTSLTQSVREMASKLPAYLALKTKLTPSGATESPTEIHVLNFDPNSAGATNFIRESKLTGWLPPIWNDKRDNLNYIVFTKTQAQNFLNPQLQKAAASMMLHEYAHSQTNYSRGNGLTLAIEERRAELLSGDTGTFNDSKQFFVYLQTFSGIDATTIMQSNPIDAEKYYTDLYKTFGIQMANQIISATPTVYLDKPSSAITKTTILTGNYNKALDAAYTIGSKDSAALQARLKARADKLIATFGSKAAALNDLRDTVGASYKLDSASSKMTAFINANYR